MNDVSIIPYSPEYQSDFKRLNIEWISTFFNVEPHDLEQLDHPEVHVMPRNGQIFLAKIGDAVVGCVAMVNTGTPDRGTPDHGMPDHGMPDHGMPDQGVTEFELAKMAVSPMTQGKGIGKKLCLAAIDYARELGVKKVWLESNRILTPALTMYASVGFREVPSIPTPYARADIRMEMVL